MTEDKKPKIDLKSRLGKTQVGVAPPAVTPSGVPAPAITPPVVGPSSPVGIAPPFATPASSPPAAASAPAVPAAPRVDASDPFAVVAAPATRTAPAEIKIDVGEEVLAAQQKLGRKTVMIAVLAGGVGLLLGFAWGSQSTEGKGQARALEAAGELVGEIDKSQAKIKELEEKLNAAVKSMREKKFPNSFASDLGGISIPFGGDKLAGRNIGRFDGMTMRMLLKYAGAVEQLNSRKDLLKNLFAGQKQAITDALAQADKPKVNYGVFVQKSPEHGPIAVLAPIPGAQAWGYKDASWPAKFKVTTGKELVEVDRYVSGDVVSTPPKVAVVPLDPDSVATSFPNDVVVKLLNEVRKTGEALTGKSGGAPDEDDTGVLKQGEQLLAALKKIGQK